MPLNGQLSWQTSRTTTPWISLLAQVIKANKPGWLMIVLGSTIIWGRHFRVLDIARTWLSVAKPLYGQDGELATLNRSSRFPSGLQATQATPSPWDTWDGWQCQVMLYLVGSFQHVLFFSVIGMVDWRAYFSDGVETTSEKMYMWVMELHVYSLACFPYAPHFVMEACHLLLGTPGPSQNEGPNFTF